MNERQRHRGPDGDGLWCSTDNAVILGHRRLAIIDLGSSGAQPMTDATGRWTLTFNGEIYNYRELRSELKQRGCVFSTNSDSEVLINVVAQWGADGLKRLRGMYAFALWDARQKQLWLARDPFGIKPLYTAQQAGVLWFASQARALAECAPVDIRRDAAALTGFYLWGHVPEPFSWWAGIQMFPAGHVQRLSIGRTPVAPQQFYSVPHAYVTQARGPIAKHTLHDVMLDSVRHHLVADTPVAIFLSAGIDSNVITALAAEAHSSLRTVTLAFNEFAGTPNDEAPLAESVAKALGSEHITVRIGKEEFDSHIETFFTHMDQPSIDGLNTYLVSHAAASQGLKVALSGVGGDELFGGYPSFRQLPLLVAAGRFVPRLPHLGKMIDGPLRKLLPKNASPKIAGIAPYSRNISSAYLLRRSLHLIEELSDLIDESWLLEGLERLATVRAISETISPLRQAKTSAYAQVSVLECCWYMRNQLLRDIDWASMAHGLEVRVPYVDVTLLERLVPAITSAAPPRKSDLSACTRLPTKAMASRPKTGFSTPVRQWTADRSSNRGLRGWANCVHREVRLSTDQSIARAH